MNTRFLSFVGLIALVTIFRGCSDSQPPAVPGTQASAATKVTLALNWYAEPEFGGFYAAREIGAFRRHGLDVAIEPGGASKPTMQMLGAGTVEFAIVSADEIVIGRSKGVDVVAIFAVYQINPQGLMAHESAGFQTIADLFAKRDAAVTLAMEPGSPYGLFLKKKYGFDNVKVVPYLGGVAQFMSDKNLVQQCFVFSEPLSAKKLGGDPKTFLIADAGYNPYTAVVATSGSFLKKNPTAVKAMVLACREGWRTYQDDPRQANAVMRQLNTQMSVEIFADGAIAQRKLIETPETLAFGIGSMAKSRWQDLGKQLLDLGVIDKQPPAEECFVDMEAPKN